MIDKAELKKKYLHYRGMQKHLHSAILSRVKKDTLLAAAGDLGICVEDTLVFESEQEIDVLSDYIIYDYRHRGKNALEWYVHENEKPLGSDKHALLEAMLHARYSLFQIVEVQEGLGITMLDLLRRDAASVIDLSMSEAVQEGKMPIGLVMAGRLVAPENLFCMTTGAMLPVNVESSKMIQGYLKENHPGRLHEIPDEMAVFSVFVIRTLLESGASSRVRFEDHNKVSVRARLKQADPYPGTNRNASCPCGSGKKYKKCCLMKGE